MLRKIIYENVAEHATFCLQEYYKEEIESALCHRKSNKFKTYSFGWWTIVEHCVQVLTGTMGPAVLAGTGTELGEVGVCTVGPVVVGTGTRTGACIEVEGGGGTQTGGVVSSVPG